MESSKQHCLTEHFSIAEKLSAQISFNAMCVAGIIGIYMAASWWAVPYAIAYLYGIPMVIMRHLACPRCDHLHVYGDCLQLPSRLTMLFIRKKKNYPFTPIERFLFYLIMLFLPLYPLFWLRNDFVWLVVFLVSALWWYGGQLLRFCLRCRVASCPFNRARSIATKKN